MTQSVLENLISSVEKNASDHSKIVHVLSNIRQRMKADNPEGLDKLELIPDVINPGICAGTFFDHEGNHYRLIVEKI